jgi:hypothetical protein
LNLIECPFSFYDLAFSASLHCAVGTDTPLKRETEKALKTASRSVATDYFLFIHYVTKNDKLTYGSNNAIFLTSLHSLRSTLQMF